MRRVLSWNAIAIIILSTGHAIAAEQGTDAVKALGFLSGSWHCNVEGKNVPTGTIDHLSYEFAPDWSWMLERSNLRQNGRTYWSAQLWGYDVRQKRLVAYQFTSDGVATKTVDGWARDRFQSHRDDNGAIVSVERVNSHAFNWVIETADRSNVVKEVCRRSGFSGRVSEPGSTERR